VHLLHPAGIMQQVELLQGIELIHQEQAIIKMSMQIKELEQVRHAFA
jgi:hypothetical protein